MQDGMNWLRTGRDGLSWQLTIRSGTVQMLEQSNFHNLPLPVSLYSGA